jgi:hypothetical protein
MQISTKDPLRRGGLIRTTYRIGKLQKLKIPIKFTFSSKRGLSQFMDGYRARNLQVTAFDFLAIISAFRHYIYTGVRIGLYELIRDTWLGNNREKISLWSVFEYFRF